MKKRELLLKALAVSMLLTGSIVPVRAEEEGKTADAQVTEAPATEAPAAKVPATEAPATEAPATEAPATEAPATEAPVTEVPATEAPATEAPVTETPVTEVPLTETLAIEVPETETPAAKVPDTEDPVTEDTQEPVSETEAEAAFSRGYAEIKKGTAVYSEKTASEGSRIGLFTEKSVVYVLERFENGKDKSGKNDWMRVVFAADRDEATEIAEGYVRVEELLPFEEKETESLVIALTQNEAHVLYKENAQIPLIPAAFEWKEEPAPEEETSEKEQVCPYEISAFWENDTLGIGDVITLTALCEPDDTVLWQSSEDGIEWTDAAKGQTYVYELTEENYRLSLRAVPDTEINAEEEK